MNPTKSINDLESRIILLEDRIKVLENDYKVCLNICTVLNRKIAEKQTRLIQ